MAANAPASGFTGVQKAAVLLTVLGDQAGAEIIRHLSEEEAQLVAREVARLKQVSSLQAEPVLEEFRQLVSARESVAKGGVDIARTMLVSAFGRENAGRLTEGLAEAAGQGSADLDALRNADPRQLPGFLHNEHPQTIALVLSHLNAPQAAALLLSLPADLRGDVVMRVASLDEISPEIIGRIAGFIGEKLGGIGELSRETHAGVKAVAGILNLLDPGISKEIESSIEIQDGELAGNIRRLMFVFDDIVTVDVSGIREVIDRVDRKVLTLALKGAGENIRNHLFQCLSERGVEALREDIDSLGPVRIREVEAAQQQIIATMRALAAEGVLSLHGGGGDEYVV